MKTSRVSSFLSASIVSVGLLCFTPAPLALAGPGSVNPQYQRAMELMEAAKRDDHPLHNLEEAKALIHDAETVQGQRSKATTWLDQAMDEAKEGRRDNMRIKIAHAMEAAHDNAVIVKEERREASAINRTLDLLEGAKHSDHAGRMLQDAKETFRSADGSDGSRHRAFALMSDAIDEAQLGHRERMRDKIDGAIDAVRDSAR